MDILRGGWAPGLQGNGAGLRADSPSTGGYDAASEAIFAAFTTPPTTARKVLIDAAVVSLKAAGVWAKLDVLYGFAAADAQAAKINWVAPGTYNATEVNAPTFTADFGFTGASTKYLDSGFNPTSSPSPKFTLNDATEFAWSLTDVDSTGGLFGGNSFIFEIRPRDTNLLKYHYNDASSAVTIANTNSTGLYAGVRSGVNTVVTYKNGVSIGTGAKASAAIQTGNVFFLQSGALYWTGQMAFGGIGSSLTAGDNTALYDALNTYLLGVGAAYQAETNAIAAAFTTPPTTARKNLIDACVVSLKSAGVWTKLDALYAFAAADSQAAKINWMAPGTFNCTEVNSPVFTADQGFTGAATKYIDMNFNAATAPSPKFVQDSGCAFAYANTNVDVDGGLIGTANGSIIIFPRLAGNFYCRVNNGSVNLTAASANSIGFWSATRSGATASEAYKNGVSVDTDVAASVTVVSQTTTILRANVKDWTGQVSAGGIGQHLSAAEQTALYNALRTYLTGVGVP